MSTPAPAIASPPFRLVDQLTFQRAPMDALTLLTSVVTDSTRYLVLDLDRTIHRGWNIGELLGWDVIAWHHYGDALLQPDTARVPGRFHIDRRNPAKLARYLLAGANRWASPGLRYFLSVKAGTRHPLSRRWIHWLFGPDPVAFAQALPRVVAMQHLAELPMTKLHELAHKIWDRHEADQVFVKADFDALRTRFPNLKILLSSASPQPVLDVAKERLGVDEVLFTDIEVHQGQMSAPYRVDLRYGMTALPHRIAGPSQMEHNAGTLKMPRLKARFPELADNAVESVGITDTGYGEDHDWANHFTRVVDVNSAHPFSPLVRQESPLKSIWSVRLHTQRERATAALPETSLGGAPIQLSKAMLHARLAARLSDLNELQREVSRMQQQVAQQVVSEESKLVDVRTALDAAAARYNASPETQRRVVFAELRTLCRDEAKVLTKLAQRRRPLSALVCKMNDARAEARQVLSAQ